MNDEELQARAIQRRLRQLEREHLAQVSREAPEAVMQDIAQTVTALKHANLPDVLRQGGYRMAMRIAALVTRTRPV